MPIDMALLAAAGLGTTKNPILAKLYGEVTEYNSIAQPLTPATRGRAIKVLDKIMKHAAVYLTSKPPQAGKVKNLDRWNALTDLATQTVAESKTVGVKLLTTPVDFRTIKSNAQSYWLERVDPKHRAGFQLSARYEEWIRGGSARFGKQTFWDYADPYAMDQVLFVHEGDVDSTTHLPIRECYRVSFAANGLASDNDGTPFTTRHMETAHSGPGWGVFVLDPDGKLYARSHQVGYFHHSTFLAGRPVAAAGELLADDNGRIRIITAKTGHYRAGPEEMVRMVTLIPELPGEALILPDFTKMNPPPRGTGQALLFKVSDFRSRGMNAPYRTRDEVIAAFPPYGDTEPAVQAMIAKVPTHRFNVAAPAFVPAAARPLNPNAPVFVPRGTI